jgi:hypothetical protein
MQCIAQPGGLVIAELVLHPGPASCCPAALLLRCPAGVGKTAIAEGPAYPIVHDLSLDGQLLPSFLRNKHLLPPCCCVGLQVLARQQLQRAWPMQ